MIIQKLLQSPDQRLFEELNEIKYKVQKLTLKGILTILYYSSIHNQGMTQSRT